jgi:hypothetical protein
MWPFHEKIVKLRTGTLGNALALARRSRAE